MNDENYLMTKIRSRVIECGGCWIWQGSMDGGSSGPVMRGPNRTILRVRRVVLESMGIDLTGKLASSSCENKRCVAPEHAQALTRKKLQQRTAQSTRYGANPVRNSRIAEHRRQRSIITMEIAEQIRIDEDSQRKKAKKYGLSQSTIGAIEQGRYWKTYAGNPWGALL